MSSGFALIMTFFVSVSTCGPQGTRPDMIGYRNTGERLTRKGLLRANPICIIPAYKSAVIATQKLHTGIVQRSAAFSASCAHILEVFFFVLNITFVIFSVHYKFLPEILPAGRQALLRSSG